MPDNIEQNDLDLDDNTDPTTAPEVPDFAEPNELDEQDARDTEATAGQPKETEQLPEEQSRVEAQEDEFREKITVPVDHQLPAEPEAAKPKRSKKRLIVYVLFVVINIAILVATLMVLKSPKQSSQTVLKSAGSEGNTADATKPPETPQTLHYVSDALKLEFDYPSDWRIGSNPDNTYITIQSAPFQVNYTTGAQAKVRGYLTIYNEYPESNLDVESKSQIAAASEKLVYKNPTKIQRSETFLSFAHPSLYNNTNIVTAAFISSDLSYSPGQIVGSKNFTKTSPFIIFRLTECEDGCTQPSDLLPVSIDTMQQTTGLLTAKEIITSMRFSE